jgi:hypothetical protein
LLFVNRPKYRNINGVLPGKLNGKIKVQVSVCFLKLITDTNYLLQCRVGEIKNVIKPFTESIIIDDAVKRGFVYQTNINGFNQPPLNVVALRLVTNGLVFTFIEVTELHPLIGVFRKEWSKVMVVKEPTSSYVIEGKGMVDTTKTPTVEFVEVVDMPPVGFHRKSPIAVIEVLLGITSFV